MGQGDTSSPTTKSSRKVFQLMGVHVNTDTKDPPGSESRISVSSSESGYSQDDFDEEYEYTVLQPRRPSSVEDLRSPHKKGMFYLQAVTYSASASKILPAKIVPKIITNQLNSKPLSLRHRDRVQPASPQEHAKSRSGKAKPTDAKPKSPPPSQTLDGMMASERKQFDAKEFAQAMWKPSIGRPEPKTLYHQTQSPPPMEKEKGTLPARDFPYPSPTFALKPAPLVLRESASKREENRQSMSHFSDVSDDEGPGMMAHARDSVMYHLRRTKRSAASSEIKSKPTATRIVVPSALSKRKQFTRGGAKHPLKSPFPSIQNSPKTKKPQWPPPGQNVERATTPSFSKRLSGVIGRLSTSSSPGSSSGSISTASGRRVSTSPMSSSVIRTESREASGRDTPMPISSSKESGGNKTGFSPNVPSTPKFMAKGTGSGSGDGNGEKSALLSPREMLEKGSMKFSDAIESARKKAGVKSKAEKRRDHLRANIVKIGAADQFPDGRVSHWV